MLFSLSGLRILVVEDEYLIASLIQQVIEAAGCIVIGPIPRLAEAIEAASAEPCDAAVLDVNLGGERVFAVADKLQRRHIPYVSSPATVPKTCRPNYTAARRPQAVPQRTTAECGF